MPGKVTQGMTLSLTTTDYQTGGTVQCAYTLTPLAPPIMNQWGNWNTWASLVPTGNPAGGSGAPGAVSNSDGSAPNPSVPSVPPTGPDLPTTPPQVCGGGSCYDAGTDQYCMVSGGQQSCISGSSARGTPGSCVSAGDSAMCAGSPSAPLPSPSVVPDPSTAVTGNDGYTQANPSTGANIGITTVTYTNPGGTPTTSGQKTGDVGPTKSTSGSGSGSSPASSSTAPGSFGGGGDCGSPPVCSGDAVMCGVAEEEWHAMCQAKTDQENLDKHLAGDGNGPPTFTADQAKYGQSDVWVQGSTGNTVGDQANAGSYNQTGFGYSRQCPLQDLALTSIPFVVKFSMGCDVLESAGYIILGFALFAAYKITAGSNE